MFIINCLYYEHDSDNNAINRCWVYCRQLEPSKQPRRLYSTRHYRIKDRVVPEREGIPYDAKVLANPAIKASASWMSIQRIGLINIHVELVKASHHSRV
jgi:hypothetical protein